MQTVTPIPACLADSQETKVSLLAPDSIGSVVTSEGYRRVRCSAAMIGLAISMSATSIFLPNQSKPALANSSVGSETTLTNLSSAEGQSKVSSSPTKLTRPAFKHQVKAGETLWKLSEEYQITPKAIAVSNNLPLQADLVAGQTIKIPSLDSPESNTKGESSSAKKTASSESLETSLVNLRETRKRLQESLVALRFQDSTVESKTKVIVTEISEVNQGDQTTLNTQSRILSRSPDSSDEQAVEIPVEMPTAQFDSQSSVSPQIIENNQLNPSSSTPINTSTLRTEQNLPSSKKALNQRQSEPLPLAMPNDSAFSKPREENPESLDLSNLETDNSLSSPSSSENSQPSPTVANNRSLNPELAEPQVIELEVEPPKTATVVPPLQMPQPQVQQSEAKKVYRVKTGDTLNNIARKHGITVAQLIKANNITNPNLIKLNQPLVIPTNAAAKKTQPRTSVISGVPLNTSRTSSQLPPVPTLGATNSSPSTLVSSLPSNSQSQGISDIPQANGAVEIPVEVATQSHTDKLRADIANLQQQYNDSQPIPLEVEAPEPSFTSAPVAQQPRNSEWDKDRLKRNSNTQSPVSRPPESSGSDQIIGTASVNIEEYNNSLRIPVGETVSPELPGLPSPDQYLPDAPARFNGYIWPAKGVLTSGYGWRWGRMHRGVDIAGPVGTPILAAAPGEVISAGWNSGGYGNLVKVQHADGSITLYAHNSRILVRRGQQVEQGQLIAEMGSTGYSTGPHLHFEVHPDGQKAVNPMAFLPKKG